MALLFSLWILIGALIYAALRWKNFWTLDAVAIAVVWPLIAACAAVVAACMMPVGVVALLAAATRVIPAPRNPSQSKA